MIKCWYLDKHALARQSKKNTKVEQHYRLRNSKKKGLWALSDRASEFFLRESYIYSSNEYDFENQDTEENRILKKGMTEVLILKAVIVMA